MPTPSSGSPISFSQIRDTFAGGGSVIRYQVSPSVFTYSSGNSYWTRWVLRSLQLWSLQIVWEGVTVYSQTASDGQPWWWDAKSISVGNGVEYYRTVTSDGSTFGVQRQQLKKDPSWAGGITDISPYVLSEYRTRRGSDANNVWYVPDSTGLGGPMAFKGGILTEIPYNTWPSPGVSGTPSVSFSNFQGFTPVTGVGNALANSVGGVQEQIAVMPPGKYFVALRAIGGGGGGGGRDTREAGNGGAGVYIQGTVVLASSETIRILVSVGGGGTGGYNGREGWYVNPFGGWVGGSYSQANPVGGAGGRAGPVGTSGFGGGGGGATEVWVQYGSSAPFLLCVAGGGGGGGGSGNGNWPSGYDPNERHGNREFANSIVGNNSNRLLYGGRGQNAFESTYTSDEVYAVVDGGGSGGAGGGQLTPGSGGGAYALGQGWYEQTGRGGRGGGAFRNNQSFTWLNFGVGFSFSSWRSWSGSNDVNAWGSGGLGGQSNGAWGSDGKRGHVEVSYSNIGINEIAALRTPDSVNFW